MQWTNVLGEHTTHSLHCVTSINSFKLAKMAGSMSKFELLEDDNKKISPLSFFDNRIVWNARELDDGHLPFRQFYITYRPKNVTQV